MKNELHNELEQIQSEFALSRKQLGNIRDDFCKDMAEKTMLRMLKTHVSPVKQIKDGGYISIDLGGSNLRVSIFYIKSENIVLKKMNTIKLKSKIKNLTTNKYSLKDLYVIAMKKLAKMINKNQHYSLVHTFSFAFNSIAKNEATVLELAKGFNLRNSQNAKIHKLLQESISELKLDIDIAAIINDSVSTLAAGNFRNKATDIACIVGTGHNSCFINQKNEIINIESACFNKNLPLTKFDKALLNKIPDEAAHLLETMIGGKYISGIAQEILSFLEEKKLIEKVSGVMTSTLTLAMNNKLRFSYKAYQKKLLSDIGRIVFGRAAKLVAAEILGIIQYSDPLFERNHNIVFDGSVYEKNSYFRECISAELESLCPENYSKITHELIKDASSTGAVIIAAGN